jgi:hypothetical protein
LVDVHAASMRVRKAVEFVSIGMIGRVSTEEATLRAAPDHRRSGSAVKSWVASVSK